MKDFFSISVKKAGALFLCFCLFVMINPPVIRLLPLEAILHYLSLFLMILIFTLSYLQGQLVFTKQRYILCLLFLLLGIAFGLPLGDHSWEAKVFLPLLTLVFIIFLDNQVYYITFGYFRKIMIFFAVCSIVLTVLLLFLPPNALPYIELEPVSTAHLNKQIVYKMYGFILSYDTIIFDIGGFQFLRVAGPMTEPGHFGILLGLTLCIEKMLYGRRTPILIICGCLTFSTAFFMILAILEMYNIFVIRKFQWKWYACTILLLIIFLFVVDNTLLDTIWEYSIGRNIGEEKSILDNRTNETALFIYNKFLQSSFSSLLWGHGTFALEVDSKTVLADYREFLYDSGFIGLFLVIITFWVIFMRVKMKFLLLFLPIIVIIFLHRAWMFWYSYLYLLPIIAFGAYTYKSSLESTFVVRN